MNIKELDRKERWKKGEVLFRYSLAVDHRILGYTKAPFTTVFYVTRWFRTSDGEVILTL